MRVVLQRVGLDVGCHPSGLSPIFPDDSFELMWTPDSFDEDERRYGTHTGRHGRPFIEYLSPTERSAAVGRSMHVNPDFESRTYGDAKPFESGLTQLQYDDLLVFYAELRPCGWEGEDALYAIGYFVVARTVMARDLEEGCIQRVPESYTYGSNPKRHDRDKANLLLICGGQESRLFERAVRICQRRGGHFVHILSEDMTRIFGDLGGDRSIERGRPLWIAEEYTDKAWEFLHGAGYGSVESMIAFAQNPRIVPGPIQ